MGYSHRWYFIHEKRSYACLVRYVIRHNLHIVGCLTGYKIEVVASLAKRDLTPDMTR